MDPQGRTIRESDSLEALLEDRNPICPSPPLGEFEISPQLITLAERHQFRGLNQENPLDHIERFEGICRLGEEFKRTLDVSSEGDFTTRTAAGASKLISNMVVSSRNRYQKYEEGIKDVNTNLESKHTLDQKPMIVDPLNGRQRGVYRCDDVGDYDTNDHRKCNTNGSPEYKRKVYYIDGLRDAQQGENHGDFSRRLHQLEESVEQIVRDCLTRLSYLILQMWPSFIANAKSGGIDLIDTYVFGNIHEPQQGQYHMTRYAQKIVKLMKSKNLYASHGGPVILSQVNACNGRQCGETLKGPNSPNKPAVWTEN
ncbi:unnamed protein product [Arabidopsis halleri]